jgi:hypothetical protein
MKILGVVFLLICNLLAFYDVKQQTEEGLYLEYILISFSLATFFSFILSKKKAIKNN